MALSDNWTMVPVRGKYVDSTGAPVAGAIAFTPSPTRLLDAQALITVMSRPIRARLDAQGAFEVLLPATDDPDITPVDFTYSVKEEFSGGSTFNIEAPSAAAGFGINIATLTPVADPASGTLVIPIGPQGPQGIPGPPGADGADGLNGTDGADGAQGPQGEIGPQGPAGADGADGADGTNATQMFLLLEAGQDETDVPGGTPVGTIIMRKV